MQDSWKTPLVKNKLKRSLKENAVGEKKQKQKENLSSKKFSLANFCMRPPSFCCIPCVAPFDFPMVTMATTVQYNLHGSQLSISTVTHHPSCAPHLSACLSLLLCVCTCVFVSIRDHFIHLKWFLLHSDRVESLQCYTFFNASPDPNAQKCWWQHGIQQK